MVTPKKDLTYQSTVDRVVKNLVKTGMSSKEATERATKAIHLYWPDKNNHDRIDEEKIYKKLGNGIARKIFDQVVKPYTRFVYRVNKRRCELIMAEGKEPQTNDEKINSRKELKELSSIVDDYFERLQYYDKENFLDFSLLDKCDKIIRSSE